MVFGVETVPWPTTAKKGGKWYRGVVEAAECFIGGKRRRRRAAGYATQQRTPGVTREGGRERGVAVVIRLSTNAKMKW